MKIFAAGLATETNTFSPLTTTLEDFEITRSADITDEAEDFGTFNLFKLWREKTINVGGEFIFGLMAWANPGGTTTQATYESLRDEILQDLTSAMPVDIVLLNLHGAMVAQNYEDCEADLIKRVRAIVGGDIVIAVELDLHANISNDTIAAADIVVSYKEYPHTDINERAIELIELAIKAQKKLVRPVMALYDCRMMGNYPTSKPAMREFIADMQEAEARPGVLSLSFIHGFPWGDTPFAGAKMLVVADNNDALAAKTAREFGLKIFDRRKDIGFDTVPMDEGLSRALSSEKAPIVVADQSDNAGGGAPSDSTFVLRWLLERNVKNVAMAIFYDPSTVAEARRAGVGAELQVRLGGRWPNISGDPLEASARVLALADDYLHEFPQESGDSIFWPIGNVAVLRIGEIDVVVSSRRQQCFSPSIFSDLNINPNERKMLIVKSTQHFYGAFSQIAAETIYLSAPGAVFQDMHLIDYRNLSRENMYPWRDEIHEGL